MNTQVLNTSGNVLNGAGLLRNNPITALRHYTEPQRESIIAVQKAVEQQYAALGKEAVTRSQGTLHTTAQRTLRN